MRKLINLGAFVLLTFTSACSTSNPAVTEAATMGGVLGTVGGAATGALIGTAISNGDVGMSALLGAGIGLPAGIAAGIIYVKSEQEAELSENDAIIKSNMEKINRTTEEVHELRSKYDEDIFGFNPDPDLEADSYIGPTIGNYGY